jgi:hypothetical protein
MRSFSEVRKELVESISVIPENFFILERDSFRLGEEIVNVVFAREGKNVNIFLNNKLLDEDFSSVKSAKEEFKNIHNMMNEMINEGISLGEILNEINIRV